MQIRPIVLPHRGNVRGVKCAASSSRRGAVTVEVALLAPFLCAMIVGICEIGQVQKDQCYLTEATTLGCATGSLPGSSNTSVISDVKTSLTASNMTANSATITIKVNNAVADVATAHRNDKISVTVAIPISATSWTGSHFFVSGNSVITRTIVMMKQG
jgi:Flp pilus assembly protein TadG